MVVQDGDAFVKASGVPRVLKLEEMKIEVVAELVAERAQERPRRRDLLSYRYPHPQPDGQGVGSIVAEEFRRPVLSYLQWSGRKHADAARWHLVENCRMFKELSARPPDIGGFPRLHRRLDGLREGRQYITIRQVEHLRPVTLVEASPVLVPWWRVSEQIFPPQSVLEKFNPEATVVPKQADAFGNLVWPTLAV